MAKLLAACVALAALSLLLPSEPSYDPWAWLVWGRELWHGALDTGGGPSWKPLPVLFTFLFAPAGKLDAGLPADLWLLVARASGLFALALAFRVAARLAGPRRAARIVAGTVAALALALVPLWLRYMAHGNEAPMAVALVLLAFERHVDGARGAAFALGAAACLLRPELFPFVALYAVYVAWRAAPWARVGLAALLVVVPALWIVPEWVGSGHPFDGGRQATSEPFWSLSLAERPWLAALRRAHHETGLALELAALAAVLLALRDRRRVELALAVAALVWLGMYVGMTQWGFSGNARYFLPALVIVCVLAGVGAGRIVDAAAALVARLPRMGRPGPVLGGAAAAALLALGAAPLVDARLGQARAEARLIESRTSLHSELEDAVRLAGGARVVTSYGPPTVNRAFETHLAYELKLAVRPVERSRARAIVFRTEALVSEPRPLPYWVAARGVRAQVGGWRVFAPPPARTAHAGGALAESRLYAPFTLFAGLTIWQQSLLAWPSSTNPSALEPFDDDHRSRISGPRQREHDPPDHRGRPSRGGGHRQALLEPAAQVLPHSQGRARDRATRVREGRDGQPARLRLIAA